MRWIDIKGCYGYQISDTGRVKSFRMRYENILKQKLDRDGYPVVSLQVNGKSKTFFIHRLVAEAFLDKQGLNQVNHKDGVKTNNSYENLEWCTPSHNTRHAIKMGLRPAFPEFAPVKGSRQGSAKLTEETVVNILELIHKKVRTDVISESYGVSETVIRNIRRGDSWSHVPRKYGTFRNVKRGGKKKRFVDNLPQIVDK